MRRPTRLALAAAAIASAFVLARPAVADPDADVPQPEVTTTAGRYWACVALDHVEVGACLSNPYPDLSRYPSVPELVRELSGVEVPRPAVLGSGLG